MNPEYIFNITIVTVFVLVVREIFNIIRLNARLSAIERKQTVIHEWTKDLHEWHSKEDDDGVKVWYVRRSLEDAITKLAENISAQTVVISKLLARLENVDFHKER